MSELELVAPGRLNEIIISDECADEAGVEREWVKLSSPTGSAFSPMLTASEGTAPTENDLTLVWYRVGSDGELLRLHRDGAADETTKGRTP